MGRTVGCDCRDGVELDLGKVWTVRNQDNGWEGSRREGWKKDFTICLWRVLIINAHPEFVWPAFIPFRVPSLRKRTYKYKIKY